jgi:ribosomal protein S18 acetylase RimI-like enzyme
MYAEDGRLLLVFSATDGDYSGHRWADGVWRPGDVPVAEAVATICRAFPGWAVSTSDVELAQALVAKGAETLRHAHAMSHDLQTLPDLSVPAGLEIGAVDSQRLAAVADQVGPALAAAYPPGHPDHRHSTAAEAAAAIRRVAAGQVLGPLLPVSVVASQAGVIVGGCLVVEREGLPPDGGPWVLDVFRHPELAAPRTGRAMLVEALHRARKAELPALSLAVSHENAGPRRLYEDVGFTDLSQSRTLAIPGN